MRDKVLNIIRETLLHENSLKEMRVDFNRQVAVLDLAQPRENGEYPDFSLRLTFTGLREFCGTCSDNACLPHSQLLGMECLRDGDLYRTTLSIGHDATRPVWTAALVFADLSYERE